MSRYQKDLSKEIRHLENSIIRNCDNIRFLKQELLSGENIYSHQAHKNLINYYQHYNLRLKINLEKAKKQVF